ncbi:MAG: YihY/virulence factor BrkB family protein [Peptostreptococcaceae bacterium]|nr:YihY/virulence factor BrkB family protein [Peptostreptococcaceae bacterium]
MSFLTKIQNKLQPQKNDPVVLYSIKALIKRYSEDNLSQLGGQLAYFFILSLFPFLMLVNQIITMLRFDTQTIIAHLHRLLPENMISILESYLGHLAITKSSGIFTFSAIFTIALASKAIISLLHSLNRAFRMEDKLSFGKSLISYPFTAISLVLILLSLLFVSVGKDLFDKIIRFFGLNEQWSVIWQVVRWIVPLSGMILVLVVLYNIIPNKGFPRKYTLVGAIFSVFLWIVMSLGLSYYTSNFGRYSLIYGSLGALMIMLLFLYWSGIVIVLGGELAHILAMRSQGRFEYDVPQE